MTKTELLQKLLTVATHDELMELWWQWHVEKGKERFILDGIVSPHTFQYQIEPKICFLLEEGYYTPETDYEKDPNFKNPWNKYIQKVDNHYIYNFRKNLQCETPWYMWNRVAFMTASILNSLGFHTDIEDALSKIAVINLKKSEGMPQSDLYGDIANYIFDDKELLQKQIEMICPDILICGRTFDVCCFTGLLDKSKMTHICDFPSESGLRKAMKYENIIILDTYHPSASRLGYDKFQKSFATIAPVILDVIKKL